MTRGDIEMFKSKVQRKNTKQEQNKHEPLIKFNKKR